MDRFLEMQTFQAVVEAGSFIKAAETLSQSGAAISRNVQQMEARAHARTHAG